MAKNQGGLKPPVFISKFQARKVGIACKKSVGAVRRRRSLPICSELQ
ncbi:hypothetical protein [Anabaena sp. 4-3]|nr:hypothetical protein [Anabaena sp. 4-3]